MFNKDSEGFKIGVNERTPGYRGGNSALHLAVLSNGPIEAKKEIVTLFDTNKASDIKNSRKFETLVTLKIPTQFSVDKCKQQVNKMRNLACRKIKFGK